MRLVVATEPSVVELNFMWLPTWLGLDPGLKKELEKELSPLLIGQALSDELLEQAHQTAINYLVKRYPEFEGLRDYLDAIKFVQPPES